MTGYNIYRGNPATLVGTVGGLTTTFSDGTVAPATAYTYTVRATDGTSESDPSDPATVTSWDTVGPQPPTGLAATVMSDTQINLVWAAGSDNVAVTGYRLYRNGSTTPDPDRRKRDVVPGRRTRGRHDVQLRAHGRRRGGERVDREQHRDSDDDGQRSASGADGLVATSVLDTEINLSWTAATDNVGVIGYRIYREDVAALRGGSGTATTYVDRPLAPQTSHTYTVYALDQAGHVSAASNAASATTPVFGDGFETGNLSRWTSAFGLVTQNTDPFSGLWGAQATSNKGTVHYAVKQLPATYSTLYYRVRFKMLSGKKDTVDILSLRTAADASLFGLRYDVNRRLASINYVTGASTSSSNLWQVGARGASSRVRLTVNGLTSQVEVWLNGTRSLR